MIRDAIVIGAGFSGLYMLHKLKSLGMNALVLEAGEDCGGVWSWNTYPGARCDIDSLEYSYSFDDALLQEWNWSQRNAPQAEILRYLNHVADRFDLREHILFKRKVASALRRDDSQIWEIDVEGAEKFNTRNLILCVGNLSLPNVPNFLGLDQFKGQVFHTARWPKTPVNFDGLNVGVIGTGSSGIQVIPLVANVAKQLHVFQRTPSYCLPARNRALASEEIAAYKANYKQFRLQARNSPLGMSGVPVPTKGALEVNELERNEAYQAAWKRGGVGFTRVFKDLATNDAANLTAAAFVRRKIRETVKDQRTASLLCPDYPIGARRVSMGTDYYETYNRDNVHLVSTKDDPIVGFTADGIRTQAAEYKLDAVVLATGFDAITGSIVKIDIRNSKGEQVSAKWANGPRTYLGIMTSGFENLFMITGPGSVGLVNAVTAIEYNVEWVADCLSYMRELGLKTVDANLQAEHSWMEEVRKAGDKTLLSKGNSWYIGANIEGKTRTYLSYAGGMGEYRAVCERVVKSDYEGLTFSPAISDRQAGSASKLPGAINRVLEGS